MNKKIAILLGVLFVLLLGFNAWRYLTADRTAPRITFSPDRLTWSEDDGEAALLADVTATDKVDGDVTASVRIKSVTPTDDGVTAIVVYYAKDSHHNIATANRIINYKAGKSAAEKESEEAAAEAERIAELESSIAESIRESEAESRKAAEEEARLLKEAEEKKQAEENARRLKELEEAAHAAALAEQARLAKERAERAAKFEEETAIMASGRHLEREQLLELLDKGGLEERVQRINELAATAAQNTDFRYITDSEIDDMRGNAEFLSQQAAESAKEFEANRAMLASLKERHRLLENERRLIAPRLAAAMSQVEKAGHEYDAIFSARSKLQTAGNADDEVSRALHDAGSGLERALEANRRQAASFEAELNGLQQQTAALEQQLQDTGRQYEEAADAIEEVTSKWLYKESAAAAARANVAEIDRTADVREEFRRLKEAEAAARAQAKPGLKKLSPFIWRRNKRG